MKELDDLLKTLETWVHGEPIYHDEKLIEAYRAYKSAKPPLVLEQCTHSDQTVLFLNQEIPVVIFKGKAYQLPENNNE